MTDTIHKCKSCDWMLQDKNSGPELCPICDSEIYEEPHEYFCDEHGEYLEDIG